MVEGKAMKTAAEMALERINADRATRNIGPATEIYPSMDENIWGATDGICIGYYKATPAELAKLEEERMACDRTPLPELRWATFSSIAEEEEERKAELEPVKEIIKECYGDLAEMLCNAKEPLFTVGRWTGSEPCPQQLPREASNVPDTKGPFGYPPCSQCGEELTQDEVPMRVCYPCRNESPAKREAREILEVCDGFIDPDFIIRELDKLNEPHLAAKVRDARRMIQGALDELADKAELPRIEWDEK